MTRTRVSVCCEAPVKGEVWHRGLEEDSPGTQN